MAGHRLGGRHVTSHFKHSGINRLAHWTELIKSKQIKSKAKWHCHRDRLEQKHAGKI